jgi:hypothetical protein
MRAARAVEARDGTWPAGPTASCDRAPGRGIRRPGCAEPPTTCARSRATGSKRLYTRTARARHVAGAGRSRVRALGAATATPAFVSIPRAHFFKIAKLPQVSTKSKFSKNRCCIGAIGVYCSQRATYVLSNGLSGNVGQSWQNSRPQVTVHSTFNSIFGQFSLKI